MHNVKQKVTPVANAVYLTEKEIDHALRFRREFTAHAWDPTEMGNALGITVYYPKEWTPTNPTNNGLLYEEEIWLRRSTPFTECLTFAEEYYLLTYAPSCVAFKEKRGVEIARWKGKSRAFAALVMIPLLEGCETVEDVYRLFPPIHRVHAHARYLHFLKHGW